MSMPRVNSGTAEIAIIASATPDSGQAAASCRRG